ncbi:substrate-binding domain-containing protein [Gelria sp. Kuro-4]|uniref:substrate-binding domain-containing protein n=1 Tax=Gelria sp. Kuro-4 TaxID=2796927 RepID=UPI001BEE3942|nr:substrate-binding domain-containing protein [Gelria sp. Kuro-4]BCV24593.1 sugar ABC transporter substrate-binding protein [Gelria sp. Kuro-4]
MRTMLKWGKVVTIGFLALALVTSLAGCGSKAQGTAGEKQVKIGFSMPFLNSPYRVAMVNQAEEWIKQNHPDWKLIVTDGQRNSAKQISDVEDLIAQRPDVIIMAPGQAQPLVPVAKKVMEAKIPLVVIDRDLNSDTYTAFVGGDNVNAGRVAAQYIAKRLNGKGNVVEIQGELGASATIDRDKGFKEEIKKYPDIKIIVDQPADYKRDKALALMEDILQAHPKIDAVYAQSDEMAFGALKAIQAAGRDKEMFVVGTDGQKAAFDSIKKDEFGATVLYPTGSVETMQLVEKILAGEQVEKRNILDTPLVTKENVDQYYDKGI